MASPRTKFFLVMTLASLLGPLAGCYSILGVKHNHTVAARLKRGMSLDEALAVLNDGGCATVEKTFTGPDRRDATVPMDSGPDGAPDRAPARAPARWWKKRETPKIRKEVVVTRFWGFAGFGTFRLFFDNDDRLVAHHLEPIN